VRWAVSRRLDLPHPVPQPELWKEVLAVGGWWSTQTLRPPCEPDA
jgi:hypothetical protein